jgi:hypothetical protein
MRNVERDWKGRSYKKGGKNIKVLKEAAALKVVQKDQE